MSRFSAPSDYDYFDEPWNRVETYRCDYCGEEFTDAPGQFVVLRPICEVCQAERNRVHQATQERDDKIRVKR